MENHDEGNSYEEQKHNLIQSIKEKIEIIKKQEQEIKAQQEELNYDLDKMESFMGNLFGDVEGTLTKLKDNVKA